MGNFYNKIKQWFDELKTRLKIAPLSGKLRQGFETMKTRLKNFGRQIAQLNKKSIKPDLSDLDDEDKPVRPANRIPRPYVQSSRKKTRPIRRFNRQRVYRLQGYTTVAKVNRKRQSERQQRLLRRLLISIVFVLILVLLFNLYNPIRDLTEWYRIIGIDKLADLFSNVSSGATTASSTGTAVATTIPASVKISPTPLPTTTKAATTTKPAATTTRKAN